MSARDRAALWNAAEAAEVRSNAVVAREWELALPAEIGAEARREIVATFARGLVERYGVGLGRQLYAVVGCQRLDAVPAAWGLQKAAQ